jgi:vacuolar protein sorting-associated protein 29
MVYILIIGDSHIPKRAPSVSDEVYIQINKLSAKRLFDYTFFTGDLINAPEFMNFLNNKTRNNVFRVIGNMDYYGGDRNLPQTRTLKIALNENDFIIFGLIHGHQATPRGDRSQLEYIASENNYNVLMSGHTHKEEVYLTKKGILLLNPGSVTGAWSFIATGNYSFITLELDKETKEISINLFQFDKNVNRFSDTATNYIYIDGKIKDKF